MPIGILVPDVDKRISAWIEIIERKKKEEKEKKKTGITITLSREFGCEAYLLAEMLKQKLEAKTGQEWIILDKDIIDRLSQDTHLSKTLIKDLGVMSSFIQDFFSSFQRGVLSKDQVFQELAEIILRVAKVGNIIIVGRGAAVITSHLENCIHFRLEAPLEYRIKSIAKRAQLDQGEAEKLVNESQAKRDKFLKDFLHIDIRDPKYFDAIYNNSKNSINSIAESILTYVAKKISK
ncbi:MAG: cytidylate kinase-like family protein [Epsilonproteobacteria bacterium]|nr:MAG: cytidylate kinase-like family protein [Campylobacterota bacterium]RLA66212.1 MAG: cytidylate kinase-like family protein [Campylobacterota bacterium]